MTYIKDVHIDQTNGSVTISVHRWENGKYCKGRYYYAPVYNEADKRRAARRILRGLRMFSLSLKKQWKETNL